MIRDAVGGFERDLAASGGSLRRLAFSLAVGRAGEDPFPARLVSLCRQGLRVALARAGTPVKSGPAHRDTKIGYRLVEALLRAAGDPDADFFGAAASGVRLGVDRVLPRAPLVFYEKTKWKLPELQDWQEPCWQENYTSAKDRPDILRAQFIEDEGEGMMLRMGLGQAKARFGDRLCIAAMAAIEKSAGSETNPHHFRRQQRGLVKSQDTPARSSLPSDGS